MVAPAQKKGSTVLNQKKYQEDYYEDEQEDSVESDYTPADIVHQNHMVSNL